MFEDLRSSILVNILYISTMSKWISFPFWCSFVCGHGHKANCSVSLMFYFKLTSPSPSPNSKPSSPESLKVIGEVHFFGLRDIPSSHSAQTKIPHKQKFQVDRWTLSPGLVPTDCNSSTKYIQLIFRMWISEFWSLSNVRNVLLQFIFTSPSDILSDPSIMGLIKLFPFIFYTEALKSKSNLTYIILNIYTF